VFGNAGGKKILKTTDGAMSWDTVLHIYNPYSANQNAVAILNKDTIVVAGGRAQFLGFVTVTHNGGLNWFLTDSLQTIGVSGISFLNNTHGIICGTGGRYFVTTNTGLNWITKETGFLVDFSKAKYVDMNTFFFIDFDGKLYFTTNNGLNWETQDCFNFNAGRPGAVFFLNQQTGWVGGDFGNYISGMFKTTNGGLTFLQIQGNNLPQDFSLSQNYPNPFNPVTKISFQIPVSGLVKLTIYDVQGKEVQTLINQKMNVGIYEVEFIGDNLSSGIYFYKITAEGFFAVRKMLLIK
jgi:hypothetical protein